MNAQNSKVFKLSLYEKIYQGRCFEDELQRLFADNKVVGWIHSNRGHEAIGAAFGMAMNQNDFLVPHHRDRPLYLAKGLSAKSLLAEIMGKKTGCCGGISGEIHIMDVETKIYGTSGVLGSGMPIGLGIAYANKLEGNDCVVVCNFGEGSSNRGSFHEVLNMAALWSLPIVFTCENNQYVEFTSIDEHMSVENVASRASGYGIEGIVTDGFSPIKSYETFKYAIEKARKGEGPTLIEAKTYRLDGHYEGDPMKYRDNKEKEYWAKRDPVFAFKLELINDGVATEEEIKVIEARVEKEMEEAIEFALQSDYPTVSDTFKNVYA
ncbi:thiamine pyrophosphate-dependent dehydrogenase E1 component subunit alpha [Desertibacillus haloalkaliphilus]|uniref:thiamine pyrophosphate-dependent dehydrogenase E1 component subunit alpha n=1 Tax=Desertibacillus haloalkaliphilus TaxID=1328930 RepID=UPI001C27BA2D|nr:thiamine pyrophosphate-dependent dehydrogenase E1 component subunit alpha [Desertibacillus haloalkaliphilus]MBU8906126.1 thiamine pyrophosphate-dependent dehydrogenase E1 component subunit alpha [Desertibacillus haloalkaliphilus]